MYTSSSFPAYHFADSSNSIRDRIRMTIAIYARADAYKYMYYLH